MPAKRKDICDRDVWFMYNIEGKTQHEIADYYDVSRGCITGRLHPEKHKEASKQWRLKNPEYMKEWNLENT